MRTMEHLRTDKQGVSGWVILGIILLSLLAWEIGGQAGGFTTPSSFFYTSEDDVYADCYLVNDITGHRIELTPISTFGGAGDSYTVNVQEHNTGWHFQIITNAPYRPLTTKWTMTYKTLHSEGSPPLLITYDLEAVKLGYTGLFTNTFDLPTQIHTVDSADIWVGQLGFYTPDGELFHAWSVGINV